MLVRDITTVRRYATVNRNMAFDTLAPHIRTAEFRYVASGILGQAQYTALDAALDAANGDETTLSTDVAALLDKVRPAIINFTLHGAVPSLAIMLSDLGFVEPSADKAQSASPQKIAELKATYWDSAQFWRQSTQEFLQENQGDYPLWVASTAYTQFNALFIRTAKELSSVIGMSEDISSFVAMSAHLVRAEDRYIRSCLGMAFMTMLKDAMREESLTDLQTEAVVLTRKALGHYALYESLPYLQFGMREGLLYVVTAIGMKTYTPLSEKQVQELREKSLTDGRAYLSELKAFCEENADHADFESYKSSTAYQGVEPAYTLPDNSTSRSFML